MKCYFCGGETEPQLVTDLYAEGHLYLAVEDVPAEVCRQCGERYYSPEITKGLLAITQKAREHSSLALPGQRAEVAICQWGDKGRKEGRYMNDFWEVLVPPLVGKMLCTLAQKREFRVEMTSRGKLKIILGNGTAFYLSRQELENAWRLLISRGSLSRGEIEERFRGGNDPYIAALLAQMPGVEHRLDPITLLYREAK